MTLVGIYLARVPAYNAEDFLALQKSSFAPFLKDLAFRWHAGQVMLDLILITVCYYAAYRLRFDGEEFDNFLRLLHGVAADRAGLQDRGAVRCPASISDPGTRSGCAICPSSRAAWPSARCSRSPRRSICTARWHLPVFRRRWRVARRVRARRDPAGRRDHRHARVVPDDESCRRHAKQAEPARARLRCRQLRAPARAGDAREHRLEHESGRLHRRRPAKAASLDRRRAGARFDRPPRGDDASSTASTR